MTFSPRLTVQVLLQVDDYNAARIKMTAEMADTSQLAKTLVIKAEDARILEDVASMRAAYSQVIMPPPPYSRLLGGVTPPPLDARRLLAAVQPQRRAARRVQQARQHGQSGRLGDAIAAHHGLVRLHLKAWGWPSDS